MLNETLVEIITNIWPTIMIFSIILISVRITYLLKNNLKLVFHKELTNLIFMIYVVTLFYIVTFQDVNFGKSNFIPFKEITRYQLGTHKFIKNVIGNMIMFIPYGYFISNYLKLNKAKLIILLSLIASITIEVMQLYIGRVFDIDDIILNVLGAILGYYLYIGFQAVKNKLPKFMRSDWFVNLFLIIIIIIMIFYLANLKPLTRIFL